MRKILSKLGALCICICMFQGFAVADSNISRKDLTGSVGDVIEEANSGSQNFDYGSLAQEIQRWIFGLVGIIAIVYIVWIGGKLLFAPGNMEEMSGAMKSLGYVILGLAIIPCAWIIVYFITHLNI